MSYALACALSLRYKVVLPRSFLGGPKVLYKYLTDPLFSCCCLRTAAFPCLSQNFEVFLCFKVQILFSYMEIAPRSE